VTLSHLRVTGAADEVAGQYGAAEINFIDGGRGRAKHLRLRESCDGTLYGVNVFDTGDVAVRDSVFSGYLDAAVYVGGIRDPNDSVTVRRNVTRDGNHGILIEDSLVQPEIEIVDNDGSQNDAGPSSAGIYIRNSDGVLIEQNSSNRNGSSGIWLDRNSDFNVLYGNSATGNGGADLVNEGQGNCGAGNAFATQMGAPLGAC
jgi:parallel beta-helix repeat protein